MDAQPSVLQQLGICRNIQVDEIFDCNDRLLDRRSQSLAHTNFLCKVAGVEIFTTHIYLCKIYVVNKNIMLETN